MGLSSYNLEPEPDTEEDPRYGVYVTCKECDLSGVVQTVADAIQWITMHEMADADKWVRRTDA